MHNKDYYIVLSMLETIEKIFRYTKDYNSPEELYKIDRDFDAAMMNFTVLGENAGKLSEDFKNKNQQINWQKIYGLRNIIAHHYFGINVDIIFFKGKAISVSAPETMELVVTDTPPNFKGDTSSGSKKPATLETGAVIQVPYHVLEGDLVKVNTVECEYLEKVK